MRLAKLALFSAGFATLLAALPAFAGDSISAEALFQAGREAAVRGDYREACAKFAESQRLDPAPGTLINLGDCKEHLGLFASAWQHYREAADRLPGDKRVEGLKARMAAIEPRLSRLTLTLAPGAPADARVTRDAVELGAASLGVAMPIDAGDHLIVVTAPMREVKRYSLTIVEAKAQVIELSPGEATASSVAPSPSPLPPAPAPGSGAGSGRVAGFVIGSLGIAGLVTSGVTGVMTLQRKNAVEMACPHRLCPTTAGLEAAAQGKTLSLVSTVAFAAGLAGAGVGIYLVVSSTPRAAPAVVALGPMIGPGNTGLQLQGQF
jgi:hypothetical protein